MDFNCSKEVTSPAKKIKESGVSPDLFHLYQEDSWVWKVAILRGVLWVAVVWQAYLPLSPRKWHLRRPKRALITWRRFGLQRGCSENLRPSLETASELSPGLESGLNLPSIIMAAKEDIIITKFPLIKLFLPILNHRISKFYSIKPYRV